jgi:hypothetical protein
MSYAIPIFSPLLAALLEAPDDPPVPLDEFDLLLPQAASRIAEAAMPAMAAIPRILRKTVSPHI